MTQVRRNEQGEWFVAKGGGFWVADGEYAELMDAAALHEREQVEAEYGVSVETVRLFAAMIEQACLNGCRPQFSKRVCPNADRAQFITHNQARILLAKLRKETSDDGK